MKLSECYKKSLLSSRLYAVVNFFFANSRGNRMLGSILVKKKILL